MFSNSLGFSLSRNSTSVSYSQNRSCWISVSSWYFLFIFRVLILINRVYRLPRFRRVRIFPCLAIHQSSSSYSQNRSCRISVSSLYFLFIFRMVILIYGVYRLSRFRRACMFPCPAIHQSSSSCSQNRSCRISVSSLYFLFIFHMVILIYMVYRLLRFRRARFFPCPAVH
jgi:hypothetical protein